MVGRSNLSWSLSSTTTWLQMKKRTTAGVYLGGLVPGPIWGWIFVLIYATADDAVAYMFYRFFSVFFLFFSSVKNMRQPFSGTAERIFMKLLPNDRGCSLQRRAAAWRMANVDDLRNLRYDSGAITRGRHARQLRYKIMSARMDLI